MTKKRILHFFTTAVLYIVFTIQNAWAAGVLYEMKSADNLFGGVVYEQLLQMTDSGMLDVHVLLVPVGDSNIGISPVESSKEHGLKETVTNLLSSNKTIAGVNGDFFGMQGTYSASFGPVFSEGQLVSVGSGINREGGEYSAFFINNEDNPFMSYLKTDIYFLNNGQKNITVHSINKVTDMVLPIIVNRQAMDNTKDLDARFTGLLKVVVDGGVVTYVSQKGETVEVPENGYVLVINETSADYFGSFYKAGQTAELKFDSTVDFNKITTAIGGGGRILLNGEVVHDSGTVIKGRQPRTAVGITADKKKLVIMVVDGRTHSIGATHEELAALLKRYGVTDAMHLDGGGSSTMAVKVKDNLRVVNTVSDGGQRKVINALGIYDKSEVGEMTGIVIEPEMSRAYKNAPLKINVYGTDGYGHKIEIPWSEVTINNNDPYGVWKEQYFYPSKSETINFIASYKQFATEIKLSVSDLMELVPYTKTVKVMEGTRTALTFSGTDANGEQTFIQSGVEYEINPPELGHMEYGTFVADKSGSGYIKCSYGEIPTYIDVYISGEKRLLSSFGGSPAISFSGYPENVKGTVVFSSEQYVSESASAKLSYQLSASDVTQAAYLVFTEPMEISGKPLALRMSVYSDKSGNLLRGRIIDADEKEHTITFSGSIDWEGWKQVQASIPSEVKYPIKLDRIYAASLSSVTDTNGELYIDDLYGIYPLEAAAVKMPEAPRFSDPLLVSLESAPENGAFDITVIGDIVIDSDEKPENYKGTQNKALDIFKKNTTRGLYAHQIDFPPDVGIMVYQKSSDYVIYKQDNTAILQMSASEGGFFATNPEQWAKFKGDVDNSGCNHLIVEIDTNPFNFNQYKEFELFHKQLVRFKESGMKVFVVSTQGSRTTNTIKDGIRYINLGWLFNEDNTVNNNFRVLRFRVNAETITYELQKIQE